MGDRRALITALVGILIIGSLSFGFQNSAYAGFPAEPTDRVFDILDTNSTGATVGLYLRELSGPVLAAHNEEFIFEPASTIKVTHFVNALSRIPSEFNFTDDVPYFQDTMGTCPLDTNSTSNTLEFGLTRMMINSDNSWTQAFRVLLGEANINATMQTLGMSDSRTIARIGCNDDGPPDNAVANPNRLTLVDAGKLYEAVTNGFLTVQTDKFYEIIDNDNGNLDTIIDQEVVGLVLSPVGLADFKSERDSALKAGSYGLSTGFYRSTAGWVELPFKNSSCSVIPHEYVYGVFINAATAIGPDDDIRAQGIELFREQIRAALETWEECEADLGIETFSVSQILNEVLIGDNVDVILTKNITNNGPASPVNVNVTVTTTTTAGLDVNATKATQQVDSVDNSKTVVIERLRLTCTGPGIQDAEFSNYIFPIDKIDPYLINNTAVVSVKFDCVIPVEINIHPASDPNSINIIKKNGVIAVAILSTGTFDATMVNASSVHFGPKDVLFNVNPLGGATEFHNKGHIEDSFELDETTQDGDLDMVLHFKAKDTELDENDTQGCLSGKIDVGGTDFTFFGCDGIKVP